MRTINVIISNVVYFLYSCLLQPTRRKSKMESIQTKKRNKRGTGVYKTLPCGTIEWTVSIVDENGKRKRPKFYGQSEAECRKNYRDSIKEGKETQPKHPEAVKPKEYTLSQWLYKWLTDYKQGTVEDSSYQDYVYLANRVERHSIGKKGLSEVTATDITRFFVDISNCGHSTLKKTKFIITSAYEAAIYDDVCIKNPVRRANITIKPEVQREAFTEAETKAILDFAKTDKLFGLTIYIMLTTAIRTGEMKCLTPKSIDYIKGVVNICQSVKRTGNLGLTKNNKPRIVPITPEALEFIAANVD